MPTARTSIARRLIPLALVLTALALVTLSIRSQSEIDPARKSAVDQTVQMQEVARRATQPIRDLIHWFGDVQTARQQRDALTAENASLRADLAKAQANEQDADELRALVGYVRSPEFPQIGDYTPRAARVVARSPSLTSSTVVIDAGEAAGVKIGDPVMAGVSERIDIGGASLVGRVERVTQLTSVVAVLSNASIAVGSTVAGRRGADGILQPSAADPSVLVLGFVRRSSVVKPGDRVITSGFLDPGGRLGSAYPRGLPIGVVSEARQSDADTYKNVLVVPWIELDSFANVIILTRGGVAS